MDTQPQDKKTLSQRLHQAIAEIKELGGLSAFKTGEWLLPLVRKSFQSYLKNAQVDHFRKKYPRASDDEIIKKLTAVAAKNAAIIGGITGAGVSANEVTAIIAGTASGGLSLPVQLSATALALAAEAITLVHIQIQLVANIAKILKVPLSPDDPEDVLLILAFAVGGAGIEGLGNLGAKTAGHLTKTAIRRHISGTTLEAVKRIAAKLGLKILQRSIIKYTVPLASVLVGGGWNYVTTKKVGNIASKHFRDAFRERAEVSPSQRPRATAAKRKSPKIAADREPRILHLNLQRQYFDEIAQGKKREECREMKPYWTKRLEGRVYDEIHFRNGYTSDAPFMRVEFRGLTTGGRRPNRRYVIALGKVLEVKR